MNINISALNQWAMLDSDVKAKTPPPPPPQPIGVNLNTLDNGCTCYRVESIEGPLDDGSGTCNWVSLGGGSWVNANNLMLNEKRLAERYDISETVEIFENPSAAKAEAKGDYLAFMKEARAITSKLKAMDSTNSLDVRFRINGASVVSKDNVPWENQQVARADKHKIQGWINEHREELQSIANKGAKYAISQAYIDYSNEVGYTRNESLCTNGHREYIGMIERYAVNGFGTNPMSYDEVKEVCGTGFTMPFEQASSQRSSAGFEVQA